MNFFWKTFIAICVLLSVSFSYAGKNKALSKTPARKLTQEKEPDGYFNCPTYSGMAQMSSHDRYDDDKWEDAGGSMMFGFSAERVEVVNQNTVICYYRSSPSINGVWIARKRVFTEFKYCEQGKLSGQYQCFY